MVMDSPVPAFLKVLDERVAHIAQADDPDSSLLQAQAGGVQSHLIGGFCTVRKITAR